LNEQLPGVACISSVSQTLYGLKYGDPQPLTSHLWTISRATFTCAAEFIGPLKAYKLSIAVIELGLDIYDNYNADNECRKPKPDPNNPNKEKDPPFNNKPAQNQKIRAVSSFDPNEMVGPKGFGDKNYVPRAIDYNYSIYFENKATATAPATEVIVIDTLDKTVFDLSSFNLKFVNFGDTTIAIPQGGYEFTTDVNLRPTLPSIVRISAHFDTVTGIAKWHYITLDTVTFDINEDPDAGFLHPNTIAPQGEGFVGFTIALRPEIGEQKAISNKATIFFDANPPIVTNTYTNYIDESIPQSGINTIVYLTEDNSPIIPLFWNASDAESGVLSYSLYVNKNNEGNQAILGSTNRTEYEFIAEPGNTYTFTCIATDSVGNKEPLTKAFDLQVDVPSSIDKPIVKEQSVFVSPNPVKDKAYVVFTTTKKANVTISVATANGTIVYTKTLKKLPEGQHTEYIDMSSYKKGVYAIQIEAEGQVRTKSIIKLDL
ncbi:MAG TPA: T9SS type A sorting domain-containing protein, partial [Bacteroidales bacterium]|nr:T9SS type A sorting domain-containing protein [Bacteroidales bacterium]